ncbi:MAG: exodeoxyribonuclease III [Candidatus Avilachnospira sp.]|jgi:exodeoxyribonuclease-3
MKKFVSWNVNGLRAIMGKGFMDVFKELDADAFCLQETKLQEGQIEMEPEGYYSYWDYAEKKGYSGTAIFVKEKPLSVKYGIGVDEHDREGRSICLEYEDYYLLTVYVPNSQNELQRLGYRMSWEDDWRRYVSELDKIKPVIYCGDLNVAHESIDLKNPKTNHHNAGFTDEERAKFSELLDAGFVDSFRYLYPDREKYSWWSYRMKARERNVGWRIDYFVVSDRIKDKIRESEILTDRFGSDHAPVELVIDL